MIDIFNFRFLHVEQMKMIFLIKSGFQIFEVFLVFLQVYFLLQHEFINVRLNLNLKLNEYLGVSIFFMEYVNICDNQASQRLSIISIHKLFSWICVFEKPN